MSQKIVKIRGIDSLLFRDARPFGNEHGALAARSLPLPMPGTVAGFLRTHLGNKAGWDWDADGPQKALATPVQGPLLKRNDEFVFPAPADAVVYKAEGSDSPKVMCLRPRPLSPGEGCDIPDKLQPLSVTDDMKPEEGYYLWKWADLERWLLHESGNNFNVPERIRGLLTDERVHVAIEEGTGISEEGMLYTVEYRSFEEHRWEGWQEKQKKDEWSLTAQIETGETISLNGAGLLGGEKRVAHVEEVSDWLECPDKLKGAIADSKQVRMVLATPAIFTGGWKPGWLDNNLSGCPPCVSGVTLKLVAAAVKRREAVSGWDYRRSEFGPKATRWVVPAGSVYFFEVVSGCPGKLATDGWLKPVSDNPQDCIDGYGLALWGVW
jgi:CRISPR-associated protein Cmr3